MAKASLFDKAKKVAPAKTTKAKDEKVRVRVKDADFFEKIQNLEKLQDRMKSDKAQADMIADEVKEIGKVEWAKVYDKSSKNPGSIMLESKSGLDTAQLMFVPSDKYITINEDRAKYLTDTFGETVVEEKTSFSFDNEMVDKYGEVLSQLIESCEEISDEDKERIVKAVVSYSISKGTIDKLKTMSDDSDMEIFDIVEEIKPVIAIKNVEVIKG
jgi:hypothetical protein